jgi:hypothetical protein
MTNVKMAHKELQKLSDLLGNRASISLLIYCLVKQRDNRLYKRKGISRKRQKSQKKHLTLWDFWCIYVGRKFGGLKFYLVLKPIFDRGNITRCIT